MKSPLTIVDIETGPRPEAELRDIQPEFAAPSNWKDPEKIAADIARQRTEWLADAALSPLTGCVLAIGYSTDGKVSIDTGDEGALLERFFSLTQSVAQGARGRLCGFAIHSFDLPFICRRALILGVSIPWTLRPTGSTRFYWPSWCTDLREIWAFGEYQPKGSLDVLCRVMGLGGKTGKGGDFARLYHGTPEQREQALDYLRNELMLTAKLAERLIG